MGVINWLLREALARNISSLRVLLCRSGPAFLPALWQLQIVLGPADADAPRQSQSLRAVYHQGVLTAAGPVAVVEVKAAFSY